MDLLREAQRVLHRQHLKEFERLNCQTEMKHKAQTNKQVLKTNSVDVYV